MLDYCGYCCRATTGPEEGMRIWSNTCNEHTVLAGQPFKLTGETHYGCKHCMPKRIAEALADGNKIIRFYENIQTNKYSCVAAAFATVMGMDVHSLIDFIGHDGTREISGQCTGFDESEIVPIALHLGYAIVRQDAVPCYGNSNTPVPDVPFDMSFTPGVVRVAKGYNDHAFAVCRNGDWYDPTTGVYVSPKKNIVSYFSVHRLFDYGIKETDFRMEVTGDLTQ